MRRICERPGCGEPVAVIYGEGGDREPQSMWIDAWSPDWAEGTVPDGARGVVCVRHGELLTPPKGWNLVDRRESIPRLFVPRPHLVVASEEAPERTRGADDSAARRRRRIVDLPTPQLFSDLGGEPSRREDRPDLEESTFHAARSSERPASDRLASDRPASDRPADLSLDDDENNVHDAMGPLLRRAFGKKNTGPSDASKELMRPTTRLLTDESA